MSNRGLPTLQEVSLEEEKTALFGVMEDATADSEGRQHTIAGMAVSQQNENALAVVSERIVLVEYTGADANNRVTEGDAVNNNLDGSNSFEDGYYAIEIEYFDGRNTANQGTATTIIPIDVFRASSESSRPSEEFKVNADSTGNSYFGRIKYNSATTFSVQIQSSQLSTLYLKAIAGLRLKIE